MEDLPLWLDLAERQGGTTLELGCGTGRVLLPLADAGHRVFGLDRDAGMLRFLVSRLSTSLAIRVGVVRAEMVAIPFKSVFNLVLIPCNTFSTLSKDERFHVLGWVSQHLAEGGLFAASMPNPQFLQSLPRISEADVEEIFIHPLDGEPVQVSSAWKRTQRFFILTWHYDHLLKDGRVHRTSAQVYHNLLSVAEILAEFTQAGLDVVEIYGDFNKSTYAQDAPNLILITKLAEF